MTMDMNIVCRFDSSPSCASDKSRIRMESLVPAKIFPARLSEAESLQIVFFFSHFSFFYIPFVVRFRRHASYD